MQCTVSEHGAERVRRTLSSLQNLTCGVLARSTNEETTLFIVFLDLKKVSYIGLQESDCKKAYDTLDRKRTIEILWKYGVAWGKRSASADPTNLGRRHCDGDHQPSRWVSMDQASFQQREE